MSLNSIISTTLGFFRGLSKQKLVDIIERLRKSYKKVVVENERLKAENAKLKESLKSKEAKLVNLKLKEVNKKSNKPSSKQAEWEQKGVGNDGKGKRKKRGKKGRKGAGNQRKEKPVTKKGIAEVDKCDNCGKDLSTAPVLPSSKSRIIEDIIELPKETEIIEVLQEQKYCINCQKVTTASTDLALPKADIGLNTTVHIVYLWLSMCLPFTRISAYLTTLFSQRISTSGLVGQIIRVAKIMQPVYEEILEDVKQSKILHADETGWRVQGKNWWLWVFGSTQSAIYTIDKSRGKDVVHRILGEYFIGVLVVDGWRAYMSLLCEQQSCMAHLLRKIRKLYAAFPKLRSVLKFYVKFRRILKDGERLQEKRKELGEATFQRRLVKLHARLDALINWKNPNEILTEIIKKVRNQRPRILTFVEHPNVPCHNNYGEYLMRIGVMKRKVSFGSKSAKGAEAYATLLSIYMTCKLRKIAFIDFIRQSLKHFIKTGKPMLLKEYVALKHNTHQNEELAHAA
ncbi:MAG: IS66 family transposase [Saprospiraceae bacterium]